MVHRGFNFIGDFFCLLQNLFVGHQHAVCHGGAYLGFQLGVAQQSADSVHSQHLRPLLLGKIVLAMGLVEFVVCLHHALHQPDEIPKDLHAADAVEILGRQILVLQGVGQSGAEIVDGLIRVLPVGGDARQIVGAYLSPGLQNGTQVAFCLQVTADEVAHRHTDGDGTVAVAELPVVIHFEAGAHGMIPDGEGVDDGVGSLDLVAQILVKTVGVDAFAGNRAVEAAQAATSEGVLPNVDDTGLPGQYLPEAVHHSLQLGVIRV